uniref:Uncharacterized protein n=1 Tax=uncultured prokaryote TaxID=198431 RepID=A0A0H5QK21_9ZZZZ|nr:hypothetical protein [uncultured prokaryote]
MKLIPAFIPWYISTTLLHSIRPIYQNHHSTLMNRNGGFFPDKFIADSNGEIIGAILFPLPQMPLTICPMPVLP